MTWSMGVALVVTIGAIAALIKRYETRLVLLSAGIFRTAGPSRVGF